MRRAPRPSSTPAPPPAARRPKAGPSPRVRLGTDERRAQLLMLGIEAFAARSYDEVSIDEIARAAGVSKGLLYHYFPTKRDFYRAAIEVVARRLLEETDLPDSVPPVERLQIGLERYLAFAERHGREFAALLRGGIGSDPDVGRIIEATRAAFVERTLERLPRAEPTPLLRTAVRGWVGFVEATSLEWAERRDVAPEALLQLWVGVLSDSLRRLDAAPSRGALAGDVLRTGRSPGRRERLKRWVVARAFGRRSRSRRLSKEDARTASSSRAWVDSAMIRIGVGRRCREPPRSWSAAVSSVRPVARVRPQARLRE
ncbi:MAG TPA: TetR/AcrR family transcriptional regulator [Polyangiaceae bacterium]|nr:TetR/AcrR family transcriptional regulator [Polyangiaceae bacterium]